MLVLATTVALLVQVYSVAYLHDDDSYPRYAAEVSLFTGAMLIVVLAADLPFMTASTVDALVAAVVPGMKAGGWGRIVNISSGAGRSVSLTGIQAYASAKAGQIGLTRQTAHELGRFGITVNCIAPGFVLSNPSTQKQWESYGEQGQRDLVDGIAVRRLGTADDIANGVRFFTAEASSWVTGQTLVIDGGITRAGGLG